MALSSSLVFLGVLVGIFSLLALGLNLKFGYTGLLDIGHVAFFLVGAYLTALLVSPPAATQQFGDYILGWSWPWIPALAVATVAAGVLGLLVALPAIRLREDYLAIAVLGISVILRRVVQSEGWLANGPDSLRGYPLPLREYFPLPVGNAANPPLVIVDDFLEIPGDIFAAVVFGAILAFLWTAAAYLVARRLGDRETAPGIVSTVAFAVTTLGVGYAAARAASRDDGPPNTGIAAAGGLVVGVVAAAAVFAGFGELAAVVFLGAASFFTWVYAVVLGIEHFDDLGLGDVGIGIGLAVAFIVPFVPVVTQGRSGMFPTLVLVVAFLGGIYYLGTRWESVGTTTPFVRIIGIAAIWLFLLRYFPIALLEQFSAQGVDAARAELVENVVWLARFGDAGLQVDYRRFLLVATFAVVAMVYYLLERTVDSPFGRVLTAIREDEDVATSLGKNVFSYKVQSMVIGSGIAGLAGGLYAIHIGALTHSLFHPRVTFIAFLIVIVGGVADNRGPILGAVIYWAFQKGTSDIAASFPPGSERASIQALRLAVFGALFIVILYYRPGGILGDEGAYTGGGG